VIGNWPFAFIALVLIGCAAVVAVGLYEGRDE
jgi:hypothetical protein